MSHPVYGPQGAPIGGTSQHLEEVDGAWVAVDDLTLPEPGVDNTRKITFGEDATDAWIGVGDSTGKPGYCDPSGSFVAFDSLIETQTKAADWWNGLTVSEWAKTKHVLDTCISVGGGPPLAGACPNNSGFTPQDSGFIGGVYSPCRSRIWLVPFVQSDQTRWFYFDTMANSVGSYLHGLGADTPVLRGYAGGALDPYGIVWWAPSKQGNQTKWHYLNSTTGVVTAFAHGLGANAPPGSVEHYNGAIYAPSGRVYFIPYGISNHTTWHYITASTKTAAYYEHGLGADTPVAYGYISGCLGVDGYIYMAPYAQSNQSKWHKINPTTGAVVAYAHGLGDDTPVQYGYAGCAMDQNGIMWLAPLKQGPQAKWHYIDTATGTVTAYAHGLGADAPVTDGYIGACLTPSGRIFFAPYRQGAQAKWHYVNTVTRTVSTYTHNVAAYSADYASYGAICDANSIVHFIPFGLADTSNYIKVHSQSERHWPHSILTNPMFNKL